MMPTLPSVDGGDAAIPSLAVTRQVVSLRAERIAAGGDALAREESGRIVFVPGALPGELVDVRLVEEKSDFARAELLSVVEPSPARRHAPCRHVAEGCGGCTWQHVEPVVQAELKVAIVREALTRTGRLPDAEVTLGPPLATDAFRTSLRLAVDTRGRTGFRAFHRHDVVPVDDCLVAHPLLADLLAVDFPGATEVSLRCSPVTGQRSVLTDPPGAVHDARLPSDVSTGRRAALEEVVAGTRLRVSARSFFQTRTDGAEALVATVRLAASDVFGSGTLVDAYAGVGLFSASLGAGMDIVAVERSPSSCADARRNLRSLGAKIIESDVEKWRPAPASLVIADPSRRGLGARAAHVLTATHAARFVLVSCDPVSLARDARLLVDHGYVHAGSTVIDLFPHTPHVEVVTKFDRL
jgi:23S rRNA (uracil1939-C5)-methyltransferase